ncbi:thioredoxin-disulfide reductase [Spirochaetia bacterium]|nr:thioredoxin-disulfide reductase [Spirochaetia bacterium]
MSDLDLIIIGAGPAGLTAAQYGARANLKVLVIEQLAPGGQVLLIDALENYPGNVEQLDAAGNVIAGPKTGFDFSQDLHRQAKSFGAAFLAGAVISLKKEEGLFIAGLASGEERAAPAVIITTGATHRNLDIPGEKEFAGRGVSYCATCDGPFFKNKKMFVVGGGDAACDEAQYLSRLGSVVLIHRRDRFRAQKAIAERVMRNQQIEVRFNTIMKEIKGAAGGSPSSGVAMMQKVGAVVLECTGTASGSGCEEDGKVYEESADAVFIFTGTTPQSALVSGNGANGGVQAELDENGYIITDQKMASSVPGLFVAGDVRSGSFRQVVVAAGEGAVAAHSASEYIDDLNHRAYN